MVSVNVDEGSEEELLLVAAGKMRLPKSSVPTGKVAGSEGIQALLDERAESR